MIVKKFLFVMRTPPYHGINLQEKLDLLLTTAAFDQSVTLLFLDDGIFQLKKNQHPEQLGLKNTSCILDSLELHNVKALFVEAETLQERGLKRSSLSLPVQLIEREQVSHFMQQFDLITSG